MLERRETESAIVITQPAHSWLAGQLATRWGNETFGDFAPVEDVRMAAALHDIGFLNWEQSPTLNPKTGMPHMFREMPNKTHFNLWSKSVQKMIGYGRYPALLVSLHFVYLTQKRRNLDSPKEFELKKNFMEAQEALQTTLITSLSNDFYYEPFVTPEALSRNSQLLAVWDWMSLTLCIGSEETATFDEVPSKDGLIKITLTKLPANRVRVSPWPFKQKTVQLTCEGRRLLTTFTDEIKMHEALRAASPVTLPFELVPN